MNPESLVTPIELRDFAKSLGWHLIEAGMADRLYVLQNPNFPRRQLVYPMDLTAPDYKESTDLVLEKLGEMLREPPDALRIRAQAVRDDTLRFRIYYDSGDRALPLGFATTLVGGMQQLLKAAACTVMRPRFHHPRLSLTEAQQLIDKSRFGHIETGSFVLRVSCPVHALDVQGTLAFDDSCLPFVRRVTLALRRGMEQLIRAIEADTLDRLVESLTQESNPLISSNLCEALTQFYDEALDNSLDVTFDWSVVEPVADIDRLPLRFQRDYFGRIEEVRRELRSFERHTKESFIGTVERLSGEMGENGRRSGEVILALLLQEGESIRARASLSAEEYEKADKAHMTEGAYVQVAGKLQQGRQPRQMSEISRFELILPVEGGSSDELPEYKNSFKEDPSQTEVCNES
ncbi:MAG: hypothetical protein NTX45_19450 [Proteobacteria bacterium]|nr:hypothetical protein [Pseudomonadota bacterium]